MEIPLCPFDSCRLLAINLYSYVIEPFTDNAKFDWPLFIEHVGYAMRIMDDIVDLEIEKVDAILTKIESDPESDEVKMVEKNLWLNIRKKAIEGRRTGLGITAEGDMLAALGFRYGTEDSNDFVEEVHKYIALSAYKESVELAKERGAFPLYDSKLEKNNPFIQRLKEADPELYKNMLKHGRRNIQLLTVAPTGSVSIMSQTTSGIEPVFKPVYKRRKKINPNDLGGKIDFIDENGDTWEEYIVFHHHFETWMKIKGYDINKKYSAKELDELVKISPYYRATSEDVDWLMKVRMQGRVQKWVDHSISVTINLPSDVDEELVGQLYMEAWKSGCKGVTVYREGSRNGVLVSATSEDLNTTNKIEERPEAINCQVQRFMYGKDQWIAFVGLLNDAPYEIFTGINNLDVFPVPSNITEGLIIKVATDKGSRYDFRYEDEYGNINTVGGLNRVFNKEFWNYARLTSALMRRGTEPQGLVEIIDKLEFTNDTLNSWKSGVLRTLRAFIKDGTKSSKAVCTQCHKTGYLEYKEGCLTCMNCGNSNCS